MTLIIREDAVPLAVDADGVARVAGTRVTLDTVVGTFEEGASAEEITLRYTTLKLADVYSVIGYYLRHQDEVRDYIERREVEAEELRKQIEAKWPPAGVRERLLARLTEREQSSKERAS